MTKSQLKSEKVEDRKEILREIFEDPEDEFSEMTGPQLDDFIDANWDEIESFFAEAEPDESEEEDEDDEAGQSDLSTPNPKTNLHYGRSRT